MDRRRFLAASGVALSAPFGGCLGALGGRTGSPERPWAPSDPVTSADGTHDLHVENHTDATETAWIRVVRDDGAPLVDGRYELPDRRGIRFDAVAAWERTYTVDLALDGADVTSREWFTAECGADSEAPGGSRDATVRITAAPEVDGHQVTLLRDQCDALYAPGVPTGSAEAFRLDE